MLGFVLKFTLVGYDYDNDAFQTINFKDDNKGNMSKMIPIANDLLEGAVFTAMVYIDPNGVDVNTPESIKEPFVNHKKSC